MARYDRRSQYDINISALPNATINDIEVTQGYAWVVTDTHLYRHNLTSGRGAGTALNTQLTTGIGSARRITSSYAHLFIVYSETANGVTTNRVERRALASPNIVDLTWTLAYKFDGEWTSYNAGNTAMMPVAGIAYRESGNSSGLYITCGGPTAGGYFEGAAFSSIDGVHNTAAPPLVITNVVYNNIRGTVVADNRLWRSSVSSSARNLTGMQFTNNNAPQTRRQQTRDNSDPPPAGSMGFAFYQSFAWFASSDATDTSLVCYQLATTELTTPIINPIDRPRFGSRLVQYDFSFKTEGSSTVRGRCVSEGYAWVLTDTHLHRHPIALRDGTGTPLTIPITPGIGDARRITTDNTHLFIAYSTTSGTIQNRVERRPLINPTQVASTWRITFSNSGNFRGATVVHRACIGIAAAAGQDRFYITCARSGTNNTDKWWIAAFDKATGTHDARVYTREQFVLDGYSSRGMTINGNQLVAIGNRYWIWWTINNRQLQSRQDNDTYGGASQGGIGSENGVLWTGSVSNRF